MVLTQNSTTLVVDETITFTSIKATVDGIKGNKVLGAATLKSSNPEVLFIANGVLKAKTIGTATVTLTNSLVLRQVLYLQYLVQFQLLQM